MLKFLTFLKPLVIIVYIVLAYGAWYMSSKSLSLAHSVQGPVSGYYKWDDSVLEQAQRYSHLGQTLGGIYRNLLFVLLIAIIISLFLAVRYYLVSKNLTDDNKEIMQKNGRKALGLFLSFLLIAIVQWFAETFPLACIISFCQG